MTKGPNSKEWKEVAAIENWIAVLSRVLESATVQRQASLYADPINSAEALDAIHIESNAIINNVTKLMDVLQHEAAEMRGKLRDDDNIIDFRKTG